MKKVGVECYERHLYRKHECNKLLQKENEQNLCTSNRQQGFLSFAHHGPHVTDGRKGVGERVQHFHSSLLPAACSRPLREFAQRSARRLQYNSLRLLSFILLRISSSKQSMFSMTAEIESRSLNDRTQLHPIRTSINHAALKCLTTRSEQLVGQSTTWPSNRERDHNYSNDENVSNTSPLP